VTTAFPSVTGPAYAPFLMGRFPGPVGLPGLRWYDRTRTRLRLPGNSRSYVGPEMRFVDTDIDRDAPTIFEIAGSSLAALNVIGRGLPADRRIGNGLWFAATTGVTHFRGNVDGWLAIDRTIAAKVMKRIREVRPDFLFAALTGVDKTSHSRGHSGAHVDDALRIVDNLVGEIRDDGERRNAWDDTHVWVVSDHGHSPVAYHEDLAGLVRNLGFRTIAHPFVHSFRGEIAVMVSGNAMAHIYLDLTQRERPAWSRLGARWRSVKAALLARDSIDLMIIPQSPGMCEIHGSRGRGHAALRWSARHRLRAADWRSDRYRITSRAGHRGIVRNDDRFRLSRFTFADCPSIRLAEEWGDHRFGVAGLGFQVEVRADTTCVVPRRASP
jgi:hypothetical protein